MPHDFTPASGSTRPLREHAKPGRVDFNVKEFENAIEDQGTFVRITPSVLCPNRTGLTDTNHVLDCPLCGGDEVVDLSSKAVEAWALVTGIKLDKKFEVPGVFDLKDAQITVPSNVKLHYFYKVEVLDFGSVFNQLVKRGAGDRDKLRYVPFETEEMPFNLIDSSGVLYEKGSQFTVEGNEIVWASSFERPASGKLFSVSYPMRPTFRILETIHDNRYHYVSKKMHHKIPVQMPQQAVMRLDYLARQQGSNNEK